MSDWVAWLVGGGCIIGFLAISGVTIYCVDQIFNQDAKYRCPTCGRATHHDYSEAGAGRPGRAEKEAAE